MIFHKVFPEHWQTDNRETEYTGHDVQEERQSQNIAYKWNKGKSKQTTTAQRYKLV